MREEILKKVIEIAKDVFDNEDIVLTEATTASDVEEWDSLTHMSLISDIEDEFGINFTLSEISGSKNLGELITALMKHVEEK
jgi:acyl carrier protein